MSTSTKNLWKKYVLPSIIYLSLITLLFFLTSYFLTQIGIIYNELSVVIIGVLVTFIAIFGVSLRDLKLSAIFHDWIQLINRDRRYFVFPFIPIIVLLISIFLSFPSIDSISFGLSSQSGYCGQGFFTAGLNARYTLEDGVLTINGHGRIRDSAFSTVSFSNSVETVVIEEGITKIGDNTFSRCKNITSIRFPKSLVSIGDGAFQGCRSLGAVDLKENASLRIGKAVFKDCESLYSVSLPDRLTIIPESLFENCYSLTVFGLDTFVELESIEKAAFKGSALSESITIPAKLEILGESAFEGCDTIPRVEVTSNKVIEIGNRAFSDCESLQAVQITSELKVDTLGDSVFEDCALLKEVTLPKKLEIIGKRTFKGCSSLEDIVLIDKGIKEIGNEAFSGCNMLVSLELPEALQRVGSTFLGDCRNLREVYFAGGVPGGLSKDSFKGHRSVFTVFYSSEKQDVWQKHLETTSYDFDVMMKP